MEHNGKINIMEDFVNKEALPLFFSTSLFRRVCCGTNDGEVWSKDDGCLFVVSYHLQGLDCLQNEGLHYTAHMW